MKTWLRRFFYWDSPAHGIVFALALLIFGSWSVWCWISLADGIVPILLAFVVWSHEPILLTGLYLCAVPLLFLIYFLIQLCHCVWVFRRGILRHRLRLSAMAVLLTLFACGSVTLVKLLIQWNCIFDNFGSGVWFFSEPPSVALIYAGVAALTPLFLISAGVAADLARIRRCRVFGRGTVTVLSLFVLSYAVSAVMAVAAARRTEAEVAASEKFFGAPLTAEALTEEYCRGQKIDAEFWKRVEHLNYKLRDEADLGRWREIIDHPKDLVSAETLAQLRESLANSPTLAEWERLFSRPLPLQALGSYDETGVLALSPNLASSYRFCRLQLARIRSAAVVGDKIGALAALRRMEHVCNLAARGKFVMSGGVFRALEALRLGGVEALLNSGSLSETELLRERSWIERTLDAWPERHRQYVYGETVFMLDSCLRTSRGHRASFGKYMPGVYSLRWLFPAAWYNMTLNRRFLVQSYRVDDFSKILLPAKSFSRGSYLVRFIFPPIENIGMIFHEAEMRCRMLITLIDLELQRRKTGAFPEKFDLPVDCYSGRPCRFRRDPETGGITIWSIGRNGRDDGGKREIKPRGSDDVAYTLLPSAVPTHLN